MAEDTKTEMVRLTKSMIAAGISEIGGGSTFDQRDRIDTAVRVFRAMLAARPILGDGSCEDPHSVGYKEGYADGLAACPSADRAEGVVSPQMQAAIDRSTAALRAVPTSSKKLAKYAPGTDPAIARLTEDLERYKKLDREAATYVESVICMRTDFDGEAETGWRGLGKAMERRFDVADAAEASLAQRDADIAKAVEDERDRLYKEAVNQGGLVGSIVGGWLAPTSMFSSDRAALRASSATQADGGAIQPAKEAGR